MKRELEDHITRVKELEEMISKLEKDKREVEQNLRAEVEIQIKVSLWTMLCSLTFNYRKITFIQIITFVN